MQMLKKIFNRDSKYYLELDEIEESKPVQAVVQTAQKAKTVVQEKTTDVLESEPLEKAAKTAQQAKDLVQDKIQDVVPDQLQSATTTEAKPKTKPQAKKSQTSSNNKKASQKNKEGASKSEKQAQAKPTDTNSGASSYEPPFWVAAMYNNNSSGGNSDGSQAETTFATDNLMPIMTKYRRRPGPSLNKFKNMARGAKTPKG